MVHNSLNEKITGILATLRFNAHDDTKEVYKNGNLVYDGRPADFYNWRERTKMKIEAANIIATRNAEKRIHTEKTTGEAAIKKVKEDANSIKLPSSSIIPLLIAENNKDPTNVPNLCMVHFPSSIRNWGTKECNNLRRPKLTKLKARSCGRRAIPRKVNCSVETPPSSLNAP